MNYVPYIVLVALLSSIVVDCVAMMGGAAAVSKHINRPKSGSGSGDSGSDSTTREVGSLAVPSGYREFIQAIQQENLKNISYLLALSPGLLDYQDPISGRTPLIIAVLSKKPKVVYLLTRYYTPNQTLQDLSRKNALAWAKQMNYKTIKKLLEHQKTFFPQGFFGKRVKDSPKVEDFLGFVHAIRDGKLADASTFLSRDHKRLLNFQDPISGQTALRVAVLAKNLDMVQFLLQQIDIDVTTVQDALRLAKQLQYSDIAQKIEAKLYALLNP